MSRPHCVAFGRYSPSLQEALADIEAVTPDDVEHLHKTFYGANHAHVAIRRRLRRSRGDRSNNRRPRRLAECNAPRMRRDYPALFLANYMLGGGAGMDVSDIA
jgi:hypothetical protein